MRGETQGGRCRRGARWNGGDRKARGDHARGATREVHKGESHRRPFTGFSEAPGRLRKTGTRASNGLSRAFRTRAWSWTMPSRRVASWSCQMHTGAPALQRNNVEWGFILDIRSLVLVAQYDGSM